MGISPQRRDLLKILPPELVEALRQPIPHEQRRAMINSMIAEQLVRLQALRYVEEIRLASGGEDDPPSEEQSIVDADGPDAGK